MKKNLLMITAIILMMTYAATICFAENPIVQTIYTADPAPMVHNETFYVYTGHDEDNSTVWFNMREWRCYSSTDMANWTDHGSPLSLATFSSWAASDAWASQCIYRNGKFYWYVTIKPKTGGWAIGVGVSNSPTGPFTDALGKPLTSNVDYYIDPTVYIDDDGQAYMFWGNPYLYMAKLNEDMISISGSITQITRNATTFNNMYGEGPWFYKRNNLYYMLFSANGSNEDIRYSTSPAPAGPWTYRGIIMPVQGIDGKIAWTNHSGVVDFKGNSYFVYHNAAIGGAFMRSACIEQFKYNADGTFPTINMTKTGPAQVGTLNPYVQTEAETICWESGVETEKCSEGGMDVCNIENGDYIKVKGVDFGTNATSFEARVASGTSGGNIEIRLGSATGTLVGTCAVTGTGGWQTWVTKFCTVSGASGVHDLYLKFTGGSGSLFNFNWWKFTGSGSTPPTPTPVPTPTPGPQSAFSQIEAESYASMSGVQTETCNEGGEDVGYIENGDYIVFSNLDFGNGAVSFQARVASATSGGNIELRLGSSTGTLIGTCPVAGIGDWQTWTTVTCNVSGVSGIKNLYLVFTGGSGYLLNFNWFKFVAASGPTSTQAGIKGDANSDGSIDIVDALMVAQYSVGLAPAGFVAANADVNCDGSITIVDALMVAQYYVGLLTKLEC